MGRLERLVIEHYRGASTKLELEFDTAKPVTLIFGENGTGKTTIADALDALGNGEVGSLKDKSSTRTRDHAPTIGKKTADVRIAAHRGSVKWICSLEGDALSTEPTPRPKIRVLRRSQLQRLVTAQPAKRYEELQKFIDVDNVERAENALRDAAANAKQQLDTAAQQQSDASEQLQRVWEEEGTPGSDAVAWAKAIAALDTAELERQARELRAIQDDIADAATAVAPYEKAAADAEKAQGENDAVDAEIETLPATGGQDALGLVEILRRMGQYLKHGTHPNECPVCRQAVDIEHLAGDIDARLATFSQHSALSDRRQAALQSISRTQQNLDTLRRELMEAARKLLSAITKSSLDALDALRAQVDDYADITSSDVNLASQAALLLLVRLSAERAALAEAETDRTKQTGRHAAIRQQYERVTATKDSSERLDKIQTALAKAYQVARLTRIAFTQKILDALAAECNRLYSAIHPNEAIAISKLELDQKRRGSLNQSARFEGHHDVPPQAYFSESHLDTLGFCFWLALAKSESRDASATIVLDDVFTSVDAQHIRRIAQLITDEAKHFAQVVVTTHQRQWRDIYKNPAGAGSITQLIELQRWSLTKGISSYRTKLAVDELSASIQAQPFDRQVTASKAGVLLEAMLDHLALQYGCRVPRKHGNEYTLGELLDGTQSLFKKLELHRPRMDASGQLVMPTEHAVSNAKAIVATLKTMTAFRNQVGAHFNPAGAEIADGDIEEFAKMTVQLAEAVSCAACGQIPGKNTGSFFQCSCAAPSGARMLPLEI